MTIQITETVWLTLTEIRELLVQGDLVATSNDRAIVKLCVQPIDRVSAWELFDLRTNIARRLEALSAYGFTEQTQVEDVEDVSNGTQRLQAWGRWSELKLLQKVLNG